MKIYYKSITDRGIKKLYFTNSVYMNYDNALCGFSLLYKCNCWYDNIDAKHNLYDDFMIPLSLEEINDTIKKYECLL